MHYAVFFTHLEMDDPRTQEEFVQLHIFRCGRGMGDHAILFQGAFSPPVPCKVFQQGRRQMSKLPIVDQRYFQEHKVPVSVRQFCFLSLEPFSPVYMLGLRVGVSMSFAALQLANSGDVIRFDLLTCCLLIRPELLMTKVTKGFQTFGVHW